MTSALGPLCGRDGGESRHLNHRGNVRRALSNLTPPSGGLEDEDENEEEEEEHRGLPRLPGETRPPTSSTPSPSVQCLMQFS